MKVNKMRFWMKLFLSMMIVFGMSFAGISLNNYTVSKSSFQPGDVGISTITLTNPTGSTRVTGLTMTIYNPAEIIVSSAPKLADIDTGGTAIVSLPLRIAEDAKPGIYLLNVEFAGFSESDRVTSTVSVPITVADLPILSLSSDANVLSGTDPIVLSLTNNGGPASQVRMKISSTSSVALYGTNEIFVGDLSDSKNLNIPIDVRSATDGPTDVPIIITYNDEIGTTHTETVNLRLTVKNEKLDIRFNQLSTIKIRDEETLDLEVVNNGDDLDDLRISFSGNAFNLLDTSDIKVGDLKSGEKRIVSAKVAAYLAPGPNLIPATISWSEKDVAKEQTMNIPLTIASDSDIGIYLESKPTPLKSGIEHTVSVLVSNLGTYPIDNVDVGLDSEAFELLDITPRQYIGSLEQDDFSTVQFKIRMKSVTGDYPILINIKYRDASGLWANKTITQNASVGAVAASGNGSVTLIVVLAVIAAIVIWYFKFRKKG
jgi:uncharacterized membrane protein